MTSLTKKQREVLEFIEQYTRKRKYAPSLDEIRKRFHLASVSTAHFHVQRLEAAGYLNRQDHKPRSMDISRKEELLRVPLLGTIAAGEPIEALPERESVLVPRKRVQNSEDLYALRVLGTSMIDEGINDGDVVLVRHQEVAKNGQKVVALIDNNYATLKKFYQEKGYIRLQPANAAMEPIIIRNGKDISIQGIVVDILRTPTRPITLPDWKSEREDSRPLPVNKIICGDSVSVLKSFPENSVDLIVTSPPYDSIRDYKGFTYDLHATGEQLHRVLKDGGIVAMVIQDQTKNFGKSLTSFRTIVDWCDSFGFKLFETVIYRKYGTEGAWWKHRFRVDHEYMPIFLKGERPAFFNKEPLKVPSKHGGKVMSGSGNRRTDGTTTDTITRMINATKCRGTVWDYLNAGDKDQLKRKHPATFPDKIPFDFVQCFCPPKGIVLDPFAGCGSTAVAAKRLGRNYIGIDISKEYCELAEERLKTVAGTLFD